MDWLPFHFHLDQDCTFNALRIYCCETSNTGLCVGIVRLDLWPSAVLLFIRDPFLLPCVLLQELFDEALGQLACVAKELLVKLVVHRRDVSQRLLLRVTEERWRATQAETAAKTFTCWLRPSSIISLGTLRFPFKVTNHPNLQYICDDSNAPVKKQHKVNPKLCTVACCMEGSRVRGN